MLRGEGVKELKGIKPCATKPAEVLRVRWIVVESEPHGQIARNIEPRRTAQNAIRCNPPEISFHKV